MIAPMPLQPEREPDVSDDIRIVSGVAYRPLVSVSPGKAVFFTGPRRIAVEIWALDWGQHEFDYELNSVLPMGEDDR